MGDAKAGSSGLSPHDGVIVLAEPDLTGPWLSRYAWWNVFPLAWERGSASGLLKQLQAPFVSELFWSVVEELGVDRIALVAGKDWWPEVRDLLGLNTLSPAPRPLIARGRVRGVAIVATYHPGARLLGVSRDAFAKAAADALVLSGPESRTDLVIR